MIFRPQRRQHTATRYNTLQHNATQCYQHCNTLQQTTTHCNIPPHTATHCHQPHRQVDARTRPLSSRPVGCNTWQHTLQHTATACSTMQHAATHGTTLHHAATRCNTLLPTETSSRRTRDAIIVTPVTSPRKSAKEDFASTRTCSPRIYVYILDVHVYIN